MNGATQMTVCLMRGAELGLQDRLLIRYLRMEAYEP
jgi:hypothetical protein